MTPSTNAVGVLTSQTLKSLLAPHVKGVSIDETRVSAHVLRPAHIVGVLSDQGRDEGKVQFAPQKPIVAKPTAPHLDVAAFGQALHASLKDRVTGYVMRMRQNGQNVYTLEWQWARTTQDGGMGWNPERQMHVASVSKLFTAMAMTKLLNEQSLSYDTKIIGYLPSYWEKGPNIDKITFRHLLNHTSGFTPKLTDFAAMKAAVLAGVSTNAASADFVGHYRYRNMNLDCVGS